MKRNIMATALVIAVEVVIMTICFLMWGEIYRTISIFFAFITFCGVVWSSKNEQEVKASTLLGSHILFFFYNGAIVLPSVIQVLEGTTPWYCGFFTFLLFVGTVTVSAVCLYKALQKIFNKTKVAI